MATFIKLYEENPNSRQLEQIVDVLENDGLVIFPSDTVYALGCSIESHKGLERLARIKGVKAEKAPFSLICHDLSNLSDYTRQIDTGVFKILKRSLPGPYTFILPGNNKTIR